MGAFSSKNTSIKLTKGDATPTQLVPTAVTLANPAEVTVADTTGIVTGDLALPTNTGYPELDGKQFIVGAVTVTTIELLGADTTDSTGSLAATPNIDVYGGDDMITLCLSSLTINNEEPTTISTATFCDPNASLPSATQAAGTITLAGYVNEDDADYIEMIEACSDGEERILVIAFPNDHGWLVAPVTCGAMGYDIPIDGAPSWSTTAVLGSTFVHIYE